jgi:ABC-type nitrate/sulfonate/bicarbonate transport system substrate-binding protein
MSRRVLAQACASLLLCALGLSCQSTASTGLSAQPAIVATSPTGLESAGTPARGESAPQALLPVVVHHFGPSVYSALIQHGIEHGYYRDEGLDVSSQFADSSVGVQLIAAGHVQFSTAAGSALAGAVRGVPVKVVFASSDRPLWWMYAEPSITRAAELRGKRVGLSSAGSSLSIVAHLILQRYGVGPDDAQYVNVVTAQRFGALQSGALDAAFLVAPANLQARRAGFRELFATLDEDVRLAGEGLATGDELLRDKPDVVERMVRGALRGLRSMREDRTAAIDTIARFTEVSPDEAAQIYDLARVTFTTDGLVDEPTLQQSIEIMKRAGEVETPVAIEQGYDLRITRQVVATEDAR